MKSLAAERKKEESSSSNGNGSPSPDKAFGASYEETKNNITDRSGIIQITDENKS